MPRSWTLCDHQGVIFGSVRGPETAREAEKSYLMDRPGRALPGRYPGSRYYVDVDTLTVRLRPTLSLPEAKTLAPNEDWTPSPIPDGTIVRLDDTVQPETTYSGLTLNFPEPGVYRVQLNPPFPYVPAILFVTVEAQA